MSRATKSGYAYGIGVITVIIGMCASIIFYTLFYLPEQMEKPSVSHEILDAKIMEIDIILGAVIDDGNDYEPKNAIVTLGVDNHVIWHNEDAIAHTVTGLHGYEDSYSGEFASLGVIKPGETFSFLFTEPGIIEYQCIPHPWMRGTITVEDNRF